MSEQATLFPALKYDDAPAAVAWLQKAFGFAEHAVHKGPDGGIAHAEMKFGNAMIMFGSTGKPDPANPWSTERMGIYMHVPDIDAHYARAKAAGAEIVRPLADTSYGAREYSARDAGGHLWSFGTYDPWTA
ncbi:VOC family protein [Dongia mobilis]|jgi:uncharacterized glyoxalase superfamily protein PhnB|uniref:VOC family protein n=1 Tax=Dongia sp. TaxID=1977262 RepID=UPI0026EED4ED